MKGLSILGSTGSIGTNVLRIVDAFPGRFAVVGLAAGRNVERLAEQVAAHRPRIVSVADEDALGRLGRLVCRHAQGGEEVLHGGPHRVRCDTNGDVVRDYESIKHAASLHAPVGAIFRSRHRPKGR